MEMSMSKKGKSSREREPGMDESENLAKEEKVGNLGSMKVSSRMREEGILPIVNTLHHLLKI